MAPSFEFPAVLRVVAESEEGARDRAMALADALVHGDAVLAPEHHEFPSSPTPQYDPDRSLVTFVPENGARRPSGRF